MTPGDTEPEVSVAGKLLVATPMLLDPNFYRTVLYILEHSEDGALGLVLNRATDEPIADHLPGWGGSLTDPEVVFVGGPVANEIAVGVVRAPQHPPDGWAPTQDGIGLVDVGLGPDAFGDTDGARVFSGYAGWVGGQLEVELSTGSWIVVSGSRDDVFTGDPGGLWRRILRRQTDRRALYASFPDDPRSN